MKALRRGITVESEEIYADDAWYGAVQLCGVDAKGRAFQLTLDIDDLSALAEIAADGLAEFLDATEAEDAPAS